MFSLKNINILPGPKFFPTILVDKFSFYYTLTDIFTSEISIND